MSNNKEKPDSEKLTNIYEAVKKLEKHLIPSTPKKILKIILPIAAAVTIVLFSWNYAKVKRQDFIKCMEKVNESYRSKAEEAIKSANGINDCGEDMGLFLVRFNKTMSEFGNIGQEFSGCGQKLIPETLKDVKSDAGRALDEMF